MLKGYASHTAEFRADLAMILKAYKIGGYDDADLVCAAIRDHRNLSPSELLTLADAFRRAVILN